MTYRIGCVLGHGPGLKLPNDEQFFSWPNRSNAFTPCQAYQGLLDEDLKDADVAIYIHDDVTIHESNWAGTVMGLFDNPQCVAVGLGGATGLGHPDLYKKPYNIWNMARSGYASNQTDAEVHGARFTGTRRVAVLDAFCMAVRSDWIRSVGGWPVGRLTHHCLDLWLACEVARHNKETWMVGVSCTHAGGGTSTKPAYAEAKWLKGGSMQTDHTEPHRWLYDSYKDCLPIRV
jgi:GT2 family glycosyltransferase